MGGTPVDLKHFADVMKVIIELDPITDVEGPLNLNRQSGDNIPDRVTSQKDDHCSNPGRPFGQLFLRKFEVRHNKCAQNRDQVNEHLNDIDNNCRQAANENWCGFRLRPNQKQTAANAANSEK